MYNYWEKQQNNVMLIKKYETNYTHLMDGQIDFQFASNIRMGSLIDLHHDLMCLILFIGFFVFFWMGILIIKFYDYKDKSIIINPWNKKVNNNFTTKTGMYGEDWRESLLVKRSLSEKILELLWTLIPIGFLFLIIGPSLAFLYSGEYINNPLPEITIVVIGHQWYWTYNYTTINNIIPEPLLNNIDQNTATQKSIVYEAINPLVKKEIDSYMLDTNYEKNCYKLRLLEVDNRLIIPSHIWLRFCITSADVIHSWAVPSLGIKCDAIPGRLNEIVAYINFNGVFYGQCSELCGINHAFMPIVIQSVYFETYVTQC